MVKQCIETTLAGYRCPRPAQEPTRYCWQHQAGSPPAKSVITRQYQGSASGRFTPVQGKMSPAKKASAKKAPAKKAVAKKAAW